MFETVKAKNEADANASMIYAPPKFADAIIEADAKIGLQFITEEYL